MNKVKVIYSDFSKENSIIENITFALLPNTVLILSQDSDGVKISMKDADTDNTELNGILDKDTLNTLIRSLSIFKGQLTQTNPA